MKDENASNAQQAAESKVHNQLLTIEGKDFEWDQETILPEKIAELGGWDPAQGVIEVDKDNNERTLPPGIPVKIQPGHGFGKKHKWKRGLIRERIQQELDLLRKYYPDIKHKEDGGEDWFQIPAYPFPEGWRIGQTPISHAPITFKVVAGHPSAAPYAFAAPAGINFKGTPPRNAKDGFITPFGDKYVLFSWAPAQWCASGDINKGQNLVHWTRSFAQRLKEGA